MGCHLDLAKNEVLCKPGFKVLKGVNVERMKE